MNEKDLKKYQIDILKKVVNRIDEFEKNDCNLCAEYKMSFDELITHIKNDSYKEYKIKFNLILKHIRQEHLIFTENEKQEEYMALGLSLGLSLGSGLGLLFGLLVFSNIALGLVFGTGIGMVLGMSLGMSYGSQVDKKNKEDGRII